MILISARLASRSESEKDVPILFSAASRLLALYLVAPLLERLRAICPLKGTVLSYSSETALLLSCTFTTSLRSTTSLLVESKFKLREIEAP